MTNEELTEVLISEEQEYLYNRATEKMEKASKRVDLCGCGQCQHELREAFGFADYVLRTGPYANDPLPDEDPIEPVHIPAKKKKKK